MSVILFSRVIGPVPVSLFISEKHTSALTITENPVENGVKITDHAVVEPKSLTLEFADDNATATYNQLVRFQESRVPFTLQTGLYVYKNMLIKNLTVTRDAKNARVLVGTCELQEIIIVSTASSGDTTGKSGKAGGKGSTNAASPSKERAASSVKDRASGTVTRGDTPERLVPLNENKSILSRVL